MCSSDLSAKLMVQITGVMLLLGGLSILTHFSIAVGALLIAVFCIAAAVQMHAFWKSTDEMEKMNEQVAFNKDLALAGAALVIYAAAQAGGVF